MSVVFRHFAWFHRHDGHWLGEWAGDVPAPHLPAEMIGDLRQMALNRWQQGIAVQITPTGAPWPACATVWNDAAWAACPPGGAVCLDVTPFGWPVGDHVWHQWHEAAHRLDWGDEHLFIELRTDTLDVIANQRSHRPIRDARPDQRMVDITGTALAPFHGTIFGRFVRRGARWRFRPLRTVPPVIRRALARTSPPFLPLLYPVARTEVPR